jgi:hypothetical protein
MTKKILLGIALVAGLLSCTKDYTDWKSPQSNDGSEPVQTLAMMVEPTASAIDIATVSSEMIQLFTTNLTQGQVSDYTVTISPADGEGEPISIVADASGYVSVAELENVVATLYGKAPIERTLSVVISAIATASTPDGNVKVRRVGSPYTLKVKLDVPVIASAYYIIGGPNDWAGSAADRSIKFNHSGKDVYEDPVFTVVFDAAASGDTWFAIGDDQACDAIANGDWNQLYGIVGGDNEAKEGKLARRSELGGDNSFKVAEGAKKIRVTINMLEGTFKVEAVNIADAYYIIGGNGSWSSDKSQKFSHSDKDVFEDPVFTYILTGGGELWFAFGEAEALDATDQGDWNQLYGYVGEQGLSGSFNRRSVLGGEYTFHVDGAAKYYRFSINVLNMTYEITPLNFSEYIWEAGVNNDWGAIEQPLYCANQDGVYTGFFYAQDADWSGGMGAFKFTGAFNNWDNGNYGTGTINDDGLSGTLINDGGSGNVLAVPGYYRATVDLANMTYSLTPIYSIGIIGPAQAGGWDIDTDLNYNPETKAWEGTVELAAGEFKFRANDNWDINWGGSADDLRQNGDNLSIGEAGTYYIQFYPLCETRSYYTISRK